MVANADSRSYCKNIIGMWGWGGGSPRDLSSPCIRWDAQDPRNVIVLNRCVESGHARGLVSSGELRSFAALAAVTAVGNLGRLLELQKMGCLGCLRNLTLLGGREGMERERDLGRPIGWGGWE